MTAADYLMLISMVCIWGLMAINVFLSVGGFLYYHQCSKTDGHVPIDEYPFVSVMVPAHNESVVIRRTVRALLNFDYPHDRYEIIVINDNSTDDTANVLKQIQAANPSRNLIVVNTDNVVGGKGKSNALNIGYSVAKGSVFAIYDADNTPEPQALRILVENLMSDSSLGAVIGKFRTRNRNASLLTRFVNIETLAHQCMNQAGRWFYFGLCTIPGTNFVMHRDIIEEIGGGIPNGKKFKAAQTGGPSGGCIPAHLIDTQIDYDNLMAIGSMMGSGGLIVMDEDNCMVDIARFFLEFTVDESCGKCTPCRVGTKRLLEILDKIISGNGELEDIDRLEELANYIKSASLCGLGQTAPNPVLSTLRYFRDEYIAHIVEKRCPAGVCKKLVRFSIQPDACIGCGKCAKNCPVDAITRTDYIAPGHKLASMQIDTKKCVKCGACISNCKFNAITKA